MGGACPDSEPGKVSERRSMPRSATETRNSLAEPPGTTTAVSQNRLPGLSWYTAALGKTAFNRRPIVARGAQFCSDSPECGCNTGDPSRNRYWLFSAQSVTWRFLPVPAFSIGSRTRCEHLKCLWLWRELALGARRQGAGLNKASDPGAIHPRDKEETGPSHLGLLRFPTRKQEGLSSFSCPFSLAQGIAQDDGLCGTQFLTYRVVRHGLAHTDRT